MTNKPVNNLDLINGVIDVVAAAAAAGTSSAAAASVALNRQMRLRQYGGVIGGSGALLGAGNGIQVRHETKL